MSNDTKILAKLLSKQKFIRETKNLPGDILELGVFKGSGLYAWLKICQIEGLTNKKVYGFDIFNEKDLIDSIKTSDSGLMKSLFEDRNFSHNEADYKEILENMLIKDGFKQFRLIKGDVSETMKDFLEDNPGLRVSLVNFDLDIYQPTINCLNMLWERIVRGGILIFDEYAIPEWTESDAVDEFLANKDVQLISTRLEAPSAYIVKK